MKGFFGILLLVIFFILLSIGAFFLFLMYKQYKGAEFAVDSLTQIESDFEYFKTYTPQSQTAHQPIMLLQEDGTLVYKSSFPPCMSLVEDRTWEIFSSSENILPTYNSKMYFDRFWRVGWLALVPRDENTNKLYTFYGPFVYSDLPKRNFIEYILIGRDIVQEGGKLQIVSTDKSCDEQSPILQVQG